MKFHSDVLLCSSFYSLHLHQISFNLNADPPKILILLQLRNIPQVEVNQKGPQGHLYISWCDIF